MNWIIYFIVICNLSTHLSATSLATPEATVEPTESRGLLEQFHEKPVCEIYCKLCSSVLSRRGMQACLLADQETLLFSTDDAPTEKVSPTDEPYRTAACDCLIENIACHTCGGIVGYHVVKACSTCLSSSHNGHFWMFHGSDVRATPRAQQRTPSCWTYLTWKHLPSPANDADEVVTLKQILR